MEMVTIGSTEPLSHGLSERAGGRPYEAAPASSCTTVHESRTRRRASRDASSCITVHEAPSAGPESERKGILSLRRAAIAEVAAEQTRAILA